LSDAVTGVLAADLGGTKCRFAFVTDDGEVLDAREVRTTKARAPFLEALESGLREVRDAATAAGRAARSIGIGTAGVISKGGRTVDYAPNLDLDRFPLAEHLEGRLHLPTTLLNDGRASALGEYAHGDARGRDPLLVLFFGTGIGIGLIVDGRPYEGATNAAGEIGHTIHVPDGRLCVCGRRGCYEAYCGGGPIVQRAAEFLGPAPDGARWSVGKLLQLAPNDPRVQTILDDAKRAACALVASACTLLNPAAVVLGGGVVTAWPELPLAIEAFTHSFCTPIVLRPLRFVRSRAGSDAVLRGAATAAAALGRNV
jgi:glucokinase